MLKALDKIQFKIKLSLLIDFKFVSFACLNSFYSPICKIDSKDQEIFKAVEELILIN